MHSQRAFTNKLGGKYIFIVLKTSMFAISLLLPVYNEANKNITTKGLLNCITSQKILEISLLQMQFYHSINYATFTCLGNFRIEVCLKSVQ